MYADHVPIISSAMRRDLNTFKRGIMFAVCSIRQSITNVPEQLACLYDGGQCDEAPLFGHKYDTLEWIETGDNAPRLWEYLNSTTDNASAIEALTQVPMLGIVKAAFVAQLMGFDVACLDSRNVKREGRNPRAFRSDGEKGKRSKSFPRKIAAYVKETGGKAQFYWDTWCDEMARVYDMTAQEISALHLAIVPGARRPRPLERWHT